MLSVKILSNLTDKPTLSNKPLKSFQDSLKFFFLMGFYDAKHFNLINIPIYPVYTPQEMLNMIDTNCHLIK